MLHIFEKFINYFYQQKYYYGWKKNNKWEEIILNNSYNELLTREFIYYNYYKYIKDIDLRKFCPPIYDQGKLSSSTANALAFGYQYVELINNDTNTFMPSRLFIYYNARKNENTVDTDSGASLSDSIKSLKYIGVCSESEWKYDISSFNIKPDNEYYNSAKLHQVNIFYAIKQDLQQLKAALIQGFPFVFGFVVYSNFDNIKVKSTGLMEMPNKNDIVVGSHAVAAIGFNDKEKHFIIRNSWGNEWGDDGHFYMPYEFILNPKYASDFWGIIH